LKAGQIVKVKVLSADTKTKRIALSIKALQAPSTPQIKHRPTQAPAAISMDDKLASLSSKWRTR
jgi:uncharacterized protein